MAMSHGVRRDIVRENSENEEWELGWTQGRGGTSEWSPSHSTSYILLLIIKYHRKYLLIEVVSSATTTEEDILANSL